MIREHDVDPRQVFICGLAAGGAMTLVMLSNYPEVFAAGAVIAGLPYGGAKNAQEALRGMFQALPKSPRDLGDLVRGASPTTTVWPKLSVWHGSADRTVNPSNAGEIIKQWLDIHGLPKAPMSRQIVDGHPREVWWNAEGKTVVESYTIAKMAHGTPLSQLEGGIAGPYMIEAGISSSHHIARFFGLTDALLKPPSRTNNWLVSLLVVRKTMRRPRILTIQAWRNVRARIANMFGVGFGKSRSSKTN